MSVSDVGKDPSLAALRQRIFGGTIEGNADYLRWKYRDNPYPDATTMIVARINGAAVAMRGMMGTSWETLAGAEPKLIPCGADLGIDQEHRNEGLFEELHAETIGRCAALGFPYMISLSANPRNNISSTVLLGWRSATGYEPLRALREDHGPMGIRRIVRSAGRRAVPGARNVSPFRRFDRSRAPDDRPITVQKEPPADQMAELVARIGHTGRIRHDRHPNYLEWRYRNPLRRYRFLTWGDSEIDAYLVLGAPLGGPRVCIVDSEAVDPELTCRLLDYAIPAGRFHALWTWAVGTSPHVVAYLRQHGFRDATGPEARHMGLLVRGTGSDISDPASWTLDGHQLVDAATWDLRMVYSDAY